MKTCPRCGAEIPESATFCPFCGSKLSGGDAPSADRAGPEPSRTSTWAHGHWRTYAVKWLMPLLVLAVAFAIFLNSAVTGVVDDAPLLTALFLVAVTCVYDFVTLEIPEWLLGSMFGFGGLYSVVFFFNGQVMAPVLWILGIGGALIVSSMVFNAYERDVYLMAAVGGLVPMRIVPNLTHFSFLGYSGEYFFLFSVIMNTAIFGVFVAAAVGFIRYRWRRGKALSVGEIEAMNDQRNTPCELKERSVPTILFHASLIAILWVAFKSIVANIGGEPRLYGTDYMIILIVFLALISFSLFFISPIDGIVNGLFVVFMFPTIMPAVAQTYVRYVLFLILIAVVLEIVNLCSEGIGLIFKRMTKSNSPFIYPYSPAILSGLFITLIFGDFLIGYIYPLVF